METIGWKPRFKSWSSLALFVFNSKLKRQHYSLDQSFRFFLEFKLEESGRRTTVVLLFTEHKSSDRFISISYYSSRINRAKIFLHCKSVNLKWIFATFSLLSPRFKLPRNFNIQSEFQGQLAGSVAQSMSGQQKM